MNGKKFKWRDLPREVPSLIQDTKPTGRTYKHPETGVEYVSVTTFLKYTQSREKEKSLEAWRKREKNWKQIMEAASGRGDAMHNALEHLLKNEPIPPFENKTGETLYNRLAWVLKRSVDNVYASEVRLFSDTLKLAGTVDCVAEWKGRLAVIDFKTALREKKEEHLLEYKIQTTIYSMMVEELFGLKVETNVILIANEKTAKAQVIEHDPNDMIEIFAKRWSGWEN